MINNFLKAVGADGNSRKPSSSTTASVSTTNSSSNVTASNVTASAATAAATALDVGENLAHTIGGWLNFQEGKFAKNGGGSVGGRYYYEERLVREMIIFTLCVFVVTKEY